MSREWHTRRLIAIEAADELLDRSGADQTRRIDVFRICEDMGLWLTFRPLSGLLGAYIPEGSGGVLITTERPRTIQRYTAAHELGHWALDHNALALDDDRSVLGRSPEERERLAQLFAEYFLLPPPLTMDVLARLGTSLSGSITAAQAYGLAREAGVSYEAAVRHLGHLEALTSGQVNELMAVSPLVIKTEVSHGRRPANGRADVWPVDERWDGQELRVDVDDEIIVSLPENRTTGYRWQDPQQFALRLRQAHPGRARSLVGGELGVDSAPNLAEGSAATGESATFDAGRRAVVAGIGMAFPESASVDVRRSDGSGERRPESTAVVVDDFYASNSPDEPSAQPAPRSALRVQDDPAHEVRSNGLAEESAGPPAPDVTVGAGGRRLLIARAEHGGAAALRLVYAPLFDPDADAAAGFELRLIVDEPRRGVSLAQLVGAEGPEAEGPLSE